VSTHRVVIKRGNRTIFGRRSDFERSGPASSLNVGVFGQSPSGWPLHSDALGVDPSTVPEWMEFDAAHGCKVDYDKDGCPVFTSPRQRKRYAEAHGYFDRNGGYGDPMPT
jgi:hypothetical protein